MVLNNKAMKTFHEKAEPDYTIALLFAMFWIVIILEYLLKG